MTKHKNLIATLGIAALILAPAAAAKHGDTHGKGKGKDAVVGYVFKGTYGGDGTTVNVTHGNKHVRNAGLVDQAVTFDFSAANVSVADTNLDGVADLNDVLAGDKVLVKSRLPRKEPGSQPFVAKKLVDQTNPEVEEPEPVEGDSGE